MRRSVHVKNHILEIREAEASDAEKMLKYIDIISSESDNITIEPGEFNVTVEQEIEFIKKYAKMENSIFLVGYIGDELVSLTNFSSSSRIRLRHTGTLAMSVLKKYWRHGIGQAMLTALIDWAKSSGIIRKMNLRVVTTNTPAIALYEKLGFVREGVITREMIIRGEFVDTYHMGLTID